ncbi:DUF4179 domain-containing protein [Clostridium sp. 19966]|uniref:DUF4179 domain-containing protein n=1 Tax=Clostridium sp. 19966 TaxID=2768166 RepID=UPI0028DF84B3|nr:DUF4179 domain-containing protein [Clostridium sp. 19966]MDT8717877.1 DUF4179 domain-containing protein [Clostridium sp. 19966]
MSYEFKNGFENIKVSKQLDYTIQSTLEKVKHDKKRKKIRNRIFKFNIGIASAFSIFIVGVNISPTFAESVKNVPVLSSLSNALQFNYDKNIVNAEKQNYAQNISKTQTDNNISVTINNVVSDDKNLFLFYTLNGSKDNKDIKNLLLNDLTITDNSGKEIFNSKDFKSQVAVPQVENSTEDYLVMTSGLNYRCIVSSLGNASDDYAKDKQTSGLIELIANKNNSIPNDINLKITGFTEAYNMSYSKDKYNEFVKKFNRQPINTEGNWAFNINLNKDSSKLKSEKYSNIKFSTNNTDFTIEALDISPAHIDATVKLGKSKVDNSQCWAIGRVIGGDMSKILYLVDEKGNKYLLIDGVFHNIDANDCIHLTFQSSYFNNSKELYLVISQLNYSPGKPFTNITPVKIRIK